MKKIVFLALFFCMFRYLCISGMEGSTFFTENQLDMETIFKNGTQDTIKDLLTCQLFIIEANFIVPDYTSILNDRLNTFFSYGSRFDMMKFNKLVSGSSFTLPNLFIEELVNPSQVGEKHYIKYPDYLIFMKGDEMAMRIWLCDFYTIIAPTLCCILNPKYDFSETFMIYMPKTYRTITQKEAPAGGDENIKKRLNIEKIDQIVAATYIKRIRG